MFTAVFKSSPSNLEVNKELRTLKPYDIYSCDPFGMPLLSKIKSFDSGP